MPMASTEPWLGTSLWVSQKPALRHFDHEMACSSSHLKVDIICNVAVPEKIGYTVRNKLVNLKGNMSIHHGIHGIWGTPLSDNPMCAVEEHVDSVITGPDL